MYAEIVVNQPSRAVDRVFDYKIPNRLIDKISIGSRVIIPFSHGNAEKEGFVLRIKPHSEVKSGIKEIIEISSEETAFKADMLEVIEYIHNRYLCTYLEIIKTIMPTGTNMKTVEWISISDLSKLSRQSDTTKKIIEYISDNGGGIDIYSLSSYFEKDIKQILSRLEKNGVIKREYKHNREITKRIIRGVRLCVSDDEALEYMGKTRSKIQQRMISILINNDYLSAADTVRFSMGNYSALSSLVKNGIVEFFDLVVEREAYKTDIRDTAPAPTNEQKESIGVITKAIQDERSDVFLLHGVTGSGKTEVFLQTIDYTVNQGKSALVLVPEISLTPQMVSRFTARFGDRVAILHSGLSLGERYDQWCRIMNNEADIVIGARSAVFAPLENIGVIIIDEEHSETYKSEMNPRYHAREVALKRAEVFGAVTVLASATPSIESYAKARSGEYTLIEMTKRYNQSSMPKIEIVDMRKELENGNKSMFSKTLYDAVRENLERKEQTILFMNRRGFSSFVSCRKCGFVPLCPNCNISLTYHSFDNTLKCHYCGHKIQNYTVCPACKSKYIRYFGGGTQRVEDEVKKLFPNATTLRLDADATTRKNSHKQILDKFVSEKIDILIGTQMVSKGLDFSGVTLVGVMSADTMLHINDFRSGERTFDLLEQVSGRAGRGDKPGCAVIQTYVPENYAIELVKTHNYKQFYRKTISERKTMWYPPFSEMICIRFTDDDNDRTRRAAFLYRETFGDINKIPEKIAILGPIPSGISKIKNKFRWQILIKSENADSLNSRILAAEESIRNNSELGRVQIQIDKNPLNIY